ncbi:hypothetical protein M8818_005842 [Zalaria obscura]|uniref:Uncharacterized protein n=1 Tax=Zalaria obscura TaxID=2024903 RepID=A0ACC3SC41_9PEZI
MSLNSSYDVVYEVTPSGNLDGDLHEFQITANDTALMTIYDIIPTDLSSIGGPKDGWIYDGIFQELDIASGELLFEWRASDHYAVEETLAPVGKKGRSEEDAFDYFHINSVDKDDKGNYYISSRYMHTITCISPSGDILWKLGGKHNDFKDLSEGAATNFAWQHHARWYPNNILTIFDNAAYDSYHSLATAENSRGLKISLDTDRMTATLLQDYVSPGIRAHSQGSVQVLPSNNVFVGWGHTSAFTEFAPNGEILCEAHFGASALFGWGWVKSYRGFKGNWTGQPSTPPDIEVRPGYLQTTAYVSWNGATEVKYWRLESTSRVTADEHEFEPIETSPKTGFESSLSIPKKTGEYLRIVALDKDYKPLGHTDLIHKKTGQLVSSITGHARTSFNAVYMLTISIGREHSRRRGRQRFDKPTELDGLLRFHHPPFRGTYFVSLTQECAPSMKGWSSQNS